MKASCPRCASVMSDWGEGWYCVNCNAWIPDKEVK